MNNNIVSTTDIQRNIRQVLEKLHKLDEPLILVKDSRPEAVMVRYDEYKRLMSLEKEIQRMQIKQVMDELDIRNKNVPMEEIDNVVREAKKYGRGGNRH